MDYPAPSDMLEGVTIEQLRTLCAVADAGSFSAAARELGRVQAAVSQSIDRLETQLGLRLFDRSGRVPRLTRDGQAIVAAARKVDGGVAALDELVTSLKRGTETSLSVVVDAMFPTASLVTFAQDFAAAHRSVELSLFTELLSAVTAQVRERRATFGIALEDADLRELEVRRVAAVRLLPVVAAAHPLAAEAQSLDAARLAEAVQIVLGERADAAASAPDLHGVFSSRRWRVVDLATKHALLLGGLGWGHMPEHVVRDDLRAGRLIELRLDVWGSAPPQRGLVLVSRRGAVPGPVARWAQERLAQLCREAITEEAATHHAV
jgi:DNA-binding transcriptional LysR family regulator